jgi:quinol-cytochrome oxidoreductase complex cytochrome b subunit
LRSFLLNLLLIVSLLSALLASFLHRTIRAAMPPQPRAIFFGSINLDIFTGRGIPASQQPARQALLALVALSLFLLVSAFLLARATYEPPVAEPTEETAP